LEVPLDALDSFKSIKLENTTIYPYVRADGATRVLTLTEDRKRFTKETFTESEEELKEKLQLEIVEIDVQANLPQIGISIIDHHPRELIYLSAKGINASFSKSNFDQKVELKVDHMQLDNQLLDAVNEVMVYYLQKDKEKPFFQMSLVKSLENTSIDFYRYFSILMQEINVDMEDHFLSHVLEFTKHLHIERLTMKPQGPPTPTYPVNVTISDSNDLVFDLTASRMEIIESFPAGSYFFTYAFFPGGKMGPITKFKAEKNFDSLNLTNLQPLKGYSKILYISTDGKTFRRIDTIVSRSTTTDDESVRYRTKLSEYRKAETMEYNGNGNQKEVVKAVEDTKVYYKMFMLNPIKVNVTFNLLGLLSDSSDNPLRIVIQMLGSTFASLDNVPIRLNALVLEDAFTGYSKLTSRIIKHYTRQGIQEIYKILGSADFLGNPVGLFSNIGTGVLDFFFEPAQGLIKSPKDFGKGLAKGTASLLKNSVYGTFNTVSKLTSTVGKVVATVSLDDDYIRKRQIKQAKEKPKHAGEGILMGARDFGMGLVEGLGGIIMQPIKGGKKEGAKGVLKGIGKGLIGIGIKPVVGAIDLVSKTTEGIRNTTTIFDKTVTRNRPPRYIGPDKALGVID